MYACMNIQLNLDKMFFQLDGWIARTWKSQSSRLGSFLDPMADKVLIAPLCIALTVQNLIPWGVTLLFVARDVAIMSAVTVIRYRSLPEPVSYCWVIHQL